MRTVDPEAGAGFRGLEVGRGTGLTAPLGEQWTACLLCRLMDGVGGLEGVLHAERAVHPHTLRLAEGRWLRGEERG